MPPPIPTTSTHAAYHPKGSVTSFMMRYADPWCPNSLMPVDYAWMTIPPMVRWSWRRLPLHNDLLLLIMLACLLLMWADMDGG